MKLLLVEDDQVVAEFISRGLTQSGYVVSHAANGVDGFDLAINETPDVGIFDLMLPGMDGFSLIESIRSRGINLPILILSAKRSVDDRVRGLQRGGDDYLVKPFSFSELLARVQALHRRSTQTLESSTLSKHGLELDLLTRRVTREGVRIDLQPKEFSLLEYLIRNADHVVSRTMIMERVWNYNFDPHTNIVEARISKLREKVDRDFEYSLIHTVRGIGYVFRREEP